jgi:hypothetical protein
VAPLVLPNAVADGALGAPDGKPTRTTPSARDEDLAEMARLLGGLRYGAWTMRCAESVRSLEGKVGLPL